MITLNGKPREAFSSHSSWLEEEISLHIAQFPEHVQVEKRYLAPARVKKTE
jgi:hypothetical protein